MKINRSTKCSLKFSTENKQKQLNQILNEAVNNKDFFCPASLSFITLEKNKSNKRLSGDL
jgi:hypothetical protein